MPSAPFRGGVLLGLAAALAIAPLTGRPTAGGVPAHGAVLSDVDGSLREIVIQYVAEAAPIAARTYADFLPALPADVRVRVVCREEADYADLRRRLPGVRCRLDPVITEHAMTCWSRDRWLACAPPRPGGPALLIAPRDEDGAEVWPRRAGDAQIARDLECDAPSRVRAWRSAIRFDGGDFVADAHTVFVAPRMVQRNVGIAVPSREALRDRLAALLGRRVVLLDDAPQHHAGMYLMLAHSRTALVGDPAWGLRLLEQDGGTAPIEVDASAATQALFDAVAGQCGREGYRVVRVPVLPGADGRTYVTYLNAVLDERPGGRTVYLPAFRGAEALDRTARGVWEGLGYRVVPVDCSDAFRHYGSLRCLVNVVRRKLWADT